MRVSLARTLRTVAVSADARRLLWHVHHIGMGQLTSVQTIRVLDKPGAQLMWAEAGQGELRIGGKVYKLRPGPKFWLYHMQDRVVSPRPGEPFINGGVCIGGPCLEAWLERLDVTANPEFEFAPAVAARIRAEQSALIRLIKRRSPDWEWQVHVRVNEMLKPFLLARALSSTNADLPAPVVRVLNAIAADPACDWKTTQFTQVAGLSQTRLRVHFRKALGETLHDYIQRTRLNLARELLSDPELRIKEVAERMHFTNEYYFSTFFRRLTGRTPSEFRNDLCRKVPQLPAKPER